VFGFGGLRITARGLVGQPAPARALEAV
jgi:hypothetical protein